MDGYAGFVFILNKLKNFGIDREDQKHCSNKKYRNTDQLLCRKALFIEQQVLLSGKEIVHALSHNN